MCLEYWPRICYKYSQYDSISFHLKGREHSGLNFELWVCTAMASSDHIVLLDFLGSPFGMRVRLALAAKGIEYQIEEEDSTQSKSSLLLKLDTVHKKIPVLIHNGKPICESLIIVAYIDEVWKDRCPLLPADPYLHW